MCRWSPGLTFSSIMATPQPLPKSPKWLSPVTALCPHAQQNSNLQKTHVMWLHPLFFSILVRHMGHKETFSLFYSTHSCKSLSMASAQETPAPCHNSRHLKQTSVSHLGHCNLTVSWFSPRICSLQSGFGQYRTKGSLSRSFFALNRSNFSKSSLLSL